MAGFRTFATGEVLTAANVNDFLMGQSVMRFADADARTAALGADVVEGMLTYNLATDQLEVFDGTNFVVAAPEPPAPGVRSFKFATDSTARSTQSGAFVNTGLELAFTPVAADSLLVVRWVTDSSNAYVTGSATGNRSVGVQVTEDDVAIATARLGRDTAALTAAHPSRPMVALQALRPAGSTTSRTYRCQIREFAGASRTRTTVNLSMAGMLSVAEISSDVL